MGENAASACRDGRPVVGCPIADTRAAGPVASGAADPFPLAVVALAASAGGLHAIGTVLAGLPAGFPAAIVVVQHLAPQRRSMIAEILGRRTPLRVKEAAEGDRLCAGVVYIAPPDQHLLVNPDGTLSLSHSELRRFLRPSADRLFESVAAAFRQRAIAVVLSGTGDDGAAGAQAVKRMGGTVLAQEEDSAEFPGMPAAVIRTGVVDCVLPLERIAPALCALVMAGEPS